MPTVWFVAQEGPNRLCSVSRTIAGGCSAFHSLLYGRLCSLPLSGVWIAHQFSFSKSDVISLSDNFQVIPSSN